MLARLAYAKTGAGREQRTVGAQQLENERRGLAANLAQDQISYFPVVPLGCRECLDGHDAANVA